MVSQKLVFVFILLLLSTFGNYCNGQGYIKVERPNSAVEICDFQTTHLVFEADILYIDIGDTKTHIIDYTNNIVRLKGEKTSKRTNLTVITTDNSYYSFYVIYSSKPQLNYFVYKVSRLHQITDTSIDKSIDKGEELSKNEIPSPTPSMTSTTVNGSAINDKHQNNTFPTIAEIESNPAYKAKTVIKNPSHDRSTRITNTARRTKTGSPIRIIESEGKVYRPNNGFYNSYDPAITRAGYDILERLCLYSNIKNSHGKVTLRVTGVYHSLDHAFIKYELENMSSVPYDIQYIEFGMIEKRKPRRTAYTEEKLDLIKIINGDVTRVLPHRIYRYVAILPKLVVPEDRTLFMEIVETGRRNIDLPIPYNRIKIESIKID